MFCDELNCTTSNKVDDNEYLFHALGAYLTTFSVLSLLITWNGMWLPKSELRMLSNIAVVLRKPRKLSLQIAGRRNETGNWNITEY